MTRILAFVVALAITAGAVNLADAGPRHHCHRNALHKCAPRYPKPPRRP
jgi:hypothetical protein